MSVSNYILIILTNNVLISLRAEVTEVPKVIQ